MRSEQSHYEELKAMQSECDRLRAERDNLATAIERVRKECDRIASTFIESDSQFASGAHKAASDIRDSIGSVGEQPVKRCPVMPRPSTGHPDVPPEYRCNICGGLVHFDGTPPMQTQEEK